MQRVCFTLQVRADRLDAYRAAHEDVWDEMLEALRLLDRVVGIGEFGPWPAGIEELPLVEPGDGEILIRARFSSVNYKDALAGTGKAAERGILFKNSTALEQATNLDTVVLDKTGTITEGKPRVSDVVPLAGFTGDDRDLLRVGASVEKGSEHPLGRAIVDHAESEGLTLQPLTEFQATGGAGVQARIENDLVMVGKPGWFEELHMDLGPAKENIERLMDVLDEVE